MVLSDDEFDEVVPDEMFVDEKFENYMADSDKDYNDVDVDYMFDVGEDKRMKEKNKIMRGEENKLMK